MRSSIRNLILLNLCLLPLVVGCGSDPHREPDQDEGPNVSRFHYRVSFVLHSKN